MKRPSEQAFEGYLSRITDHPHREEFLDVLDWVLTTYPDLVPVVKWNQPMFTHHGTFIIGFSTASKHFTIGPEGLDEIMEVVTAAGYKTGTRTIKVPYGEPVKYEVIAAAIENNLEAKKDITSFWR